MFINEFERGDYFQKDNNENNMNNKDNKIIIKKRTENQNQEHKLVRNISYLPKLKQDKSKNRFIRSSSETMIKNVTNSKEREYKEELSIINNLWEELGVTKEYQEEFKNFLYDENVRTIMFSQEKENLQKFRNSLMKLRKEILSRESNIESLIKIMKILDTQIIKENLLKEAMNIIKALRLNAINVVFYMVKVRELSFYSYFQGKFDLTQIKKEYLYNNNYLLKMTDDLNFLNNSILSKYIEFNNTPVDPFLTCCAQKCNKNESDKIVVPMTQELSKLVFQCRYIIIQDLLLDNIYKNSIVNQFSSRINSEKMKIKKYRLFGLGNIQNNITNYMKTKDFNEKGNNINLGKAIYKLKNDSPSKYNNLFFNSQNQKEINQMISPKLIKFRKRDNSNYFSHNNIINYIQNYDSPKRIIVEHDIISLTNSFEKNRKKNEETINNTDFKNKKADNNNIKNDNRNNNDDNNINININTNSYENNNINSKLEENEVNKIDVIIKENEKLKKDNEDIKNILLESKQKIEKSDKLRINLENKLKKQKEDMEKMRNSINEIKNQLNKEKNELQKKLNEEKEKNKETEKLNKELEKKLKEKMTITKGTEFEIINKEKIEKLSNEKNNELEDTNQRKKTDSIIEEDNIKNNDNYDEIKQYFNNNNINKNNIIQKGENDDGQIEESIDYDKFKNNNNNDGNEKEIKENSISYKEEKRNDNLNVIENKNIENNDTIIQNDNSQIKINEEKHENKKDNENIGKEEPENEEYKKLIEKEKKKLHIRKLSENIVEELMKLKECEISENNKYKIKYYEGNILSLIDKLKESIPFEKIDERIKTIFNLENKLYNRDSYLKGQYPQVIISVSYKNESKISGVCSFYHQNITKDENILKINFMCAFKENNNDSDNDDDLIEQFITFIKFIKIYVSFNKLYITLNYKKIIFEDKKVFFKLDEKILNLFRKKMGFSWVCIKNNKGKLRKQKLCYINELPKSINEENTKNNGCINLENISILSLTKNKFQSNIKHLGNFKFINILPIYGMLNGMKEIMLDLKEKKYIFDIKQLVTSNSLIKTYFFPEIKEIEEIKLKLNDIINKNNYSLDVIENSLFIEFFNKNNENNENKNISSLGINKMDLNIYFKNILNTKINNYYYNRISSNDIKIIKDENNNTFYNISCLNKINNILIFEITNDKIRNKLFENNNNIYELLENYYKDIFKKDNNEEKMAKKIINVYIPSFNIEAHLETMKFPKNIESINISENKELNNEPMKIGTIDEFFKINLNKKETFGKQINYEIKENVGKNDEEIIIENDFLIGIINNYKEIKLPFFQLVYVTKEQWIST